VIPAPEPVVSVMAVLAECGWVLDTESQFSYEPGLKYNFGNFEISAGRFTNRYMQEVVSFSGPYRDVFRIVEASFDMPERVASREQVFAWVAYGIRDIPLAITPDWLKEGRAQHDLLPWEQHLAAYRRRPQASVARDWMRLLGKQLLVEAESAMDTDTCRVHFDGEVVRFDVPGKTLLAQAQGDTPWLVDVIVKLPDLRGLPKRWMRDPVGIGYWEDNLVIGNRAFAAMTQPRDGAAGAQAR
jgi:hypothetical protein